MDSVSSERWEYGQCPWQTELPSWCRRAGQICLEDISTAVEPAPSTAETARDFADHYYGVAALASPYAGLIEDDGGFC